MIGTAKNTLEDDMAEHDAGRRAFLVGALVGTTAIAGGELVPTASAQKEATTPAAGHPSNGDHRGAFFNHDDAATVAAFVQRLMPGAPGKPGAHDAGVLNYIDLALAGSYSDLQDFYRRGLAQLDAYCRKSHSELFVRLDAS